MMRRLFCQLLVWFDTKVSERYNRLHPIRMNYKGQYVRVNIHGEEVWNYEEPWGTKN